MAKVGWHSVRASTDHEDEDGYDAASVMCAVGLRHSRTLLTFNEHFPYADDMGALVLMMQHAPALLAAARENERLRADATEARRLLNRLYVSSALGMVSADCWFEVGRFLQPNAALRAPGEATEQTT